MNKQDIIVLLKDWRVALWIILLVGSIIVIGPHIDSNGKFATNIQFGLDLQSGAWLQLEFKAEVIGFQTDRPVSEFIGNLSNATDTEVLQVNDNHLEIRKPYTREQLEPIFAAAGGTITSYDQGVSRETADDVKRILENKINTLGTKDARVNTITSLSGISSSTSRYIPCLSVTANTRTG